MATPRFWTVVENRHVVALFDGDAEGKKKAEAEAKLFGGRAVFMVIPDDNDRVRSRKAPL